MQNIFCLILCCFFISLNPTFAGSASMHAKQEKTVINNPFSHSNVHSAKEINPRKIMKTGLIISIISLVFLPIFLPLTFIIGTLGAILGFIGIMKLRKIGEKKWGNGIAAIIIGGLPVLLLGLLFYVFIIVFQLVEPIFL